MISLILVALKEIQESYRGEGLPLSWLLQSFLWFWQQDKNIRRSTKGETLIIALYVTSSSLSLVTLKHIRRSTHGRIHMSRSQILCPLYCQIQHLLTSPTFMEGKIFSLNIWSPNRSYITLNTNKKIGGVPGAPPRPPKGQNDTKMLHKSVRKCV